MAHPPCCSIHQVPRVAQRRRATSVSRWLGVIRQYVLMTLMVVGFVYALYTPYVFLWLRFTPDQYLRWLAGAIPWALATQWSIIWLTLRLKKRFFSK